MSAFIVSESHIDYLVTAAERWEALQYVKAQDAVTALERENHLSVASRYPLDPGDAPTPRTFHPYRGILDPVQVIKSVECYEYQSCEHDGWEESTARKICRRLKSVAIGKLPGYDNAIWGAPDEAPPVAVRKAVRS